MVRSGAAGCEALLVGSASVCAIPVQASGDEMRRAFVAIAVAAMYAPVVRTQEVPTGMPHAIEFVLPDSSLRKGYIQLDVRDAETGQGIRYALVCLGLPRPTWVVTDPFGGVRAGKLPSRDIAVRVLAPGFAVESVLMHPGRQDRRSAVVHLTRNDVSSGAISCSDDSLLHSSDFTSQRKRE